VSLIEANVQRAIEHLVHEWARTIDEDRLEELAELLADPGEYKVASRFNVDRNLPLAVIHCKSRAQLRDRITSLRVANIYEKHHYRHIVSGVQIIGRVGDEYEVRANYMVNRIMEHDGSTITFSTGQYRDRVVFVDGSPKFRQRHVIFDSRGIETLLVIPL
jgi:anthranilate 1,2-dioxygenase small subunit